MASNSSIYKCFFHTLKEYNSTNFKTIYKLDLSDASPTLLKSFSSVVTRFFIFQEKHPEYSAEEMKVLYFRLRIDLVARYFSEYPVGQLDDLRPFQVELRRYVDNDPNCVLEVG